ncbi:thymidylate kinase [Bacterioplanes sanyensis]|uniref:dTMP kinase n=1 Tax=Bacterioplanes sanyensis TaxID=1249553 RepID=UPI00167B7923|nr:dTMP kinase [Bacterioplanes sanyensis]GGY42065.1 thymidylate kinase [Bacterioplanes sanyensis]
MTPSAGRFITFEGGEGVGKTTNIQFLADWLRQHGHEVVTTREPGGTEIAELIRDQLLKAHHDEPMDDLAELLLMFAARAQHLQGLIKPALAAGKWVLCDRFSDSTLAYQGYGRGVDLSMIEQLKRLVQGSLEPDLTLWLKAPLAVGRARASGRAEVTDRFEAEQDAFFQRVEQGFEALAREHARIVAIDANQALPGVQQAIVQAIKTLEPSL